MAELPTCCEADVGALSRGKSIRASSSTSGAFISHCLWVCDLGQEQQQQQQEARDYLEHQGNTTKFTSISASFEDLVFASHRWYTCVLSPTRFPGQWKLLPSNHGSVAHISATRIQGTGDLLLVGVEDVGLILRFCFQQGCWISTHQMAPMFPRGRSVWFQGAFYVGSTQHRRRRRWDGESDEPPESLVFSVMRFAVGTGRWEELELSQRDKGILNSGIFHLLLLQGRLLIFLLPWPYLESRGCELKNDLSWRVEAEVIGEGKRLMVFELVDDARGDDASEEEEKKKKKLVDVSGELSKALDLASQQNATNFFNSDGDDESGVLFWITSRGKLAAFSTLRNEMTMAGMRMHPSNPRPADAITLFHYVEHFHHTGITPPGEQSFMVSHFTGLKDFNFQP